MAVLARAEITLSGMDYVTGSEFVKTTESITAKVEQSAKTASQAIDMASEVKQTAAGISSTVDQHYEEQVNGQKAVLDRVSAVEQTAKGLSSKVEAISGDYATKAQLQQTADEISTTVDKKLDSADAEATYAKQSQLQQTAESLTVSISQTISRADALADATANLDSRLDDADRNVANLSGALASEVEERRAYMRFSQDASGGPLLELGAAQSANKVQLTDDRLSFMSGQAEVAYVSQDRMTIANATIANTLTLGSFAFVPRSDGHLSLVRVR